MVLPITDAAWLMIESSETPQHAGALMIFEFPEDAEEDWVRRLYERFGRCTEPTWPFNQKLKHPYGRFKLYSWISDTDIDLEYHLRLSSLPPPGGDEELMGHVSRLHAVTLDRTRPLWEIHLIDGIRPAEGSSLPRFAMHAKFHHALFDGVGSMRILRRMFSDDPALRDMPPPWQTSAEASGAGRNDRKDNAVKRNTVKRDTVKDGAREAVGGRTLTLRTVGSAVATTARTLSNQRKGRRDGVSYEALPFVAPRSIINTKITGSRRVITRSWSLDRMLAISKALDVSLNDVVVAMSAHAIRSFLIESDALPTQPMTAMIPVSIRAETDSASGNALSFVVADLGTNLADPGDRIQRISESIGDAKARLMVMGRIEQITFGLAVASPYLIGPLVGLGGYGPPPMNIVISNVPGPESTQYLDGATLRAIYPASVLEQGQGLNITMASYDRQMQFALTACRKSLPEVRSMLGFMEEGLAALEMST